MAPAKRFAWLEPAFFALLCAPAAYYWTTVRPAAQAQLASAALFAALAFASTYYLIPALGPRFLARNLKGKDMGRRGTPEEHVEMCVPARPTPGAQARPTARPQPPPPSHPTPPHPPCPSPSGVGLVCAVVFLICVTLSQWRHELQLSDSAKWWLDLHQSKTVRASAPPQPCPCPCALSTPPQPPFPPLTPPLPRLAPRQVVFYHSALLSICFMTLLGFADDVLDLPWRYKFILPVFASLPLLATYNGGTDIVLPSLVGQLRGAAPGGGAPPAPTALGALVQSLSLLELKAAEGGAVLVEMGMWYYVYMGCLGVFATNAINIHAGINGLEAGQAVVIAIAVLTTNLMEIASDGKEPHQGAHLFSALLGLPFLAVTLAVLAHNVFPARAFVGDTFCYFAGMTLAVQGIHGHFAKTLLIFFAPQAFNFFYSLPQIAKVYPCPRHRLPHFNAATGLLEPSRFEVPAGKASGGGGGSGSSSSSSISSRGSSSSMLAGAPASIKSRRRSVSSSAAAGAGLPAAEAGAPRMMDNFTLINLVLRLLGPMHERTTTNVLLVLQAAACLAGLALRVWHSNSVCTGEQGRAWSVFSTYGGCS